MTRITQSFSALSSFRRDFFMKYGLRQYHSLEEPAIFFGIYKPHWHRITKHKGLLVIVWAGTDMMQLLKDQHMIEYLKSRKNTFHVAISKYIANDLDTIGIPYTKLPITPYVPDLGPVPIGDCVYCYVPPQFESIYGGQIVKKLQKKLPYLKFIQSHIPKLSRDQLIRTVYSKCFLGLRLNKHDGLPNTAMELGLMGRKVVWNGGTPHTLSWNSEKDLIRTIKIAYKERKSWDVKKISQDVKNYLSMSDDWLHTEYWEEAKKGLKVKAANTPVPKKVVVKPEVAKVVFKKTPTVCIIINTINENPDLLLQAIESYEKQVGVFVQLIISTIAGDPSIQVAKNRCHTVAISKRKGIYEQLNNAIKLMNTDWFSYASGNDVAHPQKSILEIGECLKTKKKVCYSSIWLTDSVLTVTGIRRYYPYSHKKHINVGNFVTDCAMMSRKILKTYSPFHEQWGNAAYYDFWLRVFEGEGNVFCYNPIPTWYYRYTKSSAHVVRSYDKKKQKADRDLKARMLAYHRKLKKGVKK